ncbi:hemerythrin domain-containing protein [Thiohalorhabdus sp.]|uniref:hemerythrin domain-containing protein n=1 Tax=Thiohalorhabdus sp. TaxID=3094134 RepID=UPI002FC2B132
MHPDTPTAPDFNDPIGLLRACHGRVEHFADLARRLADHELDTPPVEPVRQAAGKVLRYFEHAAPLHHADEEVDLLPRLRRHLDPQPDRELVTLLGNLEGEHGELQTRWIALRPLLEALEQGHPVDPKAYREAVRAFHAAQTAHLNRENRHLLPAAEARLTAAELAALGTAMAQRRGVGQNKAN